MERSAFIPALDMLVGQPWLTAAQRGLRRRASWARSPNICGFGIGLRTSAGNRLGEIALKVYVRKKLPRSAIPAAIPAFIHWDGSALPVDVEVMPRGGAHATARAGEGVAHEGSGYGTIGCLVERPGQNDIFVLSNSHVLALCGLAHEGDVINLADRAGAGERIGTLDNWVNFVEGSGYHNLVDAAIAKLDKTTGASTNIADIGKPTGVSYVVDVGVAVSMRGATTGARKTTIIDSDFFGELDYITPAGGRTYGFRDQFLVEPVNEGGDSGAMALNDRGRIVGMHCWGNSEHGVYNKIRNIMDELGVQPMVTEKAPTALPSAQGDMTALSAPANRPPVRSRESAIDTLARTLYGEARGEGRDGMEAVACVIVNRAFRRTARWGDTVEAVCRKPKQFSCWNGDDVNLRELLDATVADPAFRMCMEVAERAVDGELKDVTSGSTHYCTTAANPTWASGKTPAFTLRHHLFYNNVA